MQIPTIGRFKAQRLDDGTIYCYERSIPFKGASVALLIYPNGDGTPLSDSQKEDLRRRFRDFEGSVDAAVADLPRQLRRLSRDYELDLATLTDHDLRDGLNWQNIKLMPDDEIECYTNHGDVSKSLDIVLLFSGEMRLQEVHFDG